MSPKHSAAAKIILKRVYRRGRNCAPAVHAFAASQGAAPEMRDLRGDGEMARWRDGEMARLGSWHTKSSAQPAPGRMVISWPRRLPRPGGIALVRRKGQKLGGLLARRAAGDVTRDEGRVHVFENHIGADDDLLDVLAARHFIHDREQDFLKDRAEAA